MALITQANFATRYDAARSKLQPGLSKQAPKEAHDSLE